MAYIFTLHGAVHLVLGFLAHYESMVSMIPDQTALLVISKTASSTYGIDTYLRWCIIKQTFSVFFISIQLSAPGFKPCYDRYSKSYPIRTFAKYASVEGVAFIPDCTDMQADLHLHSPNIVSNKCGNDIIKIEYKCNQAIAWYVIRNGLLA